MGHMPTSFAAGVLVAMLRQQSEQGRPRSSPEDAPPQAAQGDALRPLGDRPRAYGIGLRLRSLRLLFDRLAGFCGPEPVRPFSCTGVHLHPAPQHIVSTRMRRAGKQEGNPAQLAQTIQDLASELPRSVIPRTRVNRGKRKRQGMVPRSFFPRSCGATRLVANSRFWCQAFGDLAEPQPFKHIPEFFVHGGASYDPLAVGRDSVFGVRSYPVEATTARHCIL